MLMKMDSSVQSIELSMIIPSKEKVVIDDNFQKLVESIRMNGILEPLLLRPLGEKYEIVIGNKRYEAARLLGIRTVPVIVKKVDDEVLEQYKVLNNYDKKNHDLNEKKDKFIPSTRQNTKPIKNNTSLSQNSSNKEELQKSSTNNNNYFKMQNKRNQYSDIINLSELNKKEYERNDFNMNNNLANNNVGVTPQTTNLNNQEPTFGGRFFPSLEDEPTNMNMGGMSGPIQQIQEINSNLIDLTDINQESSNPSIMPNANNLNANLSPTLSSGPTLNTNLVQNSQFEIGKQQESLSPIPGPTDNIINIGNLQNELVQEKNAFNQVKMPNQMQGNNALSESTGIPQGQVYDTPTQNFSSTQNLGIPSQSEFSQPIPPQFDMSKNVAPTGFAQNQEPHQSQIEISQPTQNFEKVPVSPYTQEISPVVQNNQTEPLAPTLPSQSKDLTPVTNILKNLLLNLEAFGYKISFNEENLSNSIKITVEIEI